MHNEPPRMRFPEYGQSRHVLPSAYTRRGVGKHGRPPSERQHHYPNEPSPGSRFRVPGMHTSPAMPSHLRRSAKNKGFLDWPFLKRGLIKLRSGALFVYRKVSPLNRHCTTQGSMRRSWTTGRTSFYERNKPAFTVTPQGVHQGKQCREAKRRAVYVGFNPSTCVPFFYSLVSVLRFHINLP